MKVAQAVPSIKPVKNLETCVFSQIPNIVNDQSIVIGTSARKSQNRGSGSTASTGRQRGYASVPPTNPK